MFQVEFRSEDEGWKGYSAFKLQTVDDGGDELCRVAVELMIHHIMALVKPLKKVQPPTVRGLKQWWAIKGIVQPEKMAQKLQRAYTRYPSNSHKPPQNYAASDLFVAQAMEYHSHTWHSYIESLKMNNQESTPEERCEVSLLDTLSLILQVKDKRRSCSDW